MGVIIPCGGRKLDRRAPAVELYIGSYFRACLNYARARVVGDDSRIYILSARHGLVTLRRELEPYNERLPRPELIPFEFLSRVERQARELLLRGSSEPIEIIGGRSYVHAATWAIPHATAPMPRGLGIGGQLHWLAVHTAEELEAARWNGSLRNARWEVTPRGRAALEESEESELLEAESMERDALALGLHLAAERDSPATPGEVVFQVPATLEGFRYRRLK